MREYVLHVKVKNNLILGRILQRHETVAEFCRVWDLPQTKVGALINMKDPALTTRGAWTKYALDVADALGELPEDLFTEEQRTARLAQNEAFVEMSRQQALAACGDFASALENRDFVEKLLARATHTKQQRRVLDMRYGLQTGVPMLEAEVAEALGLSKTRVNQIEAKALRRLRGLLNYDGEEVIPPTPPLPVAVEPPQVPTVAASKAAKPKVPRRRREAVFKPQTEATRAAFSRVFSALTADGVDVDWGISEVCSDVLVAARIRAGDESCWFNHVVHATADVNLVAAQCNETLRSYFSGRGVPL